MAQTRLESRPPESRKPSGASASSRFSTPAMSFSRIFLRDGVEIVVLNTRVTRGQVGVADEFAVRIVMSRREREDVRAEADKVLRLAGEDDRRRRQDSRRTADGCRWGRARRQGNRKPTS